MGLDAFVSCRCWQDGLTTPPPFGPVGLDSDGQIDLLLPLKGNEEAHRAVSRWRETACPHGPYMNLVLTGVSNWPGVGAFRSELRNVRDHVPTLLDGLTWANGGTTSVDDAARALDELEWFRANARLSDRLLLLDEDTGDEVQAWVQYPTGWQTGLDRDAFWVREVDIHGRRDPRFRAQRFRQRVVDGGTEFSDGNQTVVVPIGPVQGPRPGLRCPVRMRATTRPQTIDEFEYILAPLEKLFWTAVETGNPVGWC
jgi:hypothetical protein